MNLYSNKQRWKVVLLILALAIVGITLWYSNHIAEKIRNDERKKVELWSEAIKRRAELVNFTQSLFDQLKSEENKKAKLLASAYNIISDPNPESDLTFITEYLWSNTTIPVLIYDEHGKAANSVNLPPGKEDDIAYIDSLRKAVEQKNPPIELKEVGMKVYYDDSKLFQQLQATMDDLINSFISETVINSASVPVIVTDSTQTEIIRKGNIDEQRFANSNLLEVMKNANLPILIDIPGQGKQYIFYEDSEVLKQLRLFPVYQLILIGVFLLVAYLSFSTFRKAEQNQVWVGMSKETAHQLGTPLSSLMAWTALLEAQGVDNSIINELNKDVDRLNTITDRFSKIGSVPELKEENIFEVMKNSIDYLQSRISDKIKFSMETSDPDLTVFLNIPLFGWVIENLVKNAADAMEGEGKLHTSIHKEGRKVCIDISDSGKGVSKSNWKTVFEPGFTTKKRGWGLGLSLVKRIVEQYHGGRIYIKNSDANGTTFRIELRD